MAALVGMGVCLLLLYLWIIGHWFGRMGAFLAFGSGLVIFAWAATFKDPSITPVLAICAAVCAAWFLAGTPQYYINYKRGAARRDSPLRLHF